MENMDDKWVKQVLELAKTDGHYRECARAVARLEPDFLRIRKKLNPSEQETLDLYIAACEELSFSLIYPARQLGQFQKKVAHHCEGR